MWPFRHKSETDFESWPIGRSLQSNEALREACEAVPEHLRCYCGGMDTRDTLIRAALYGEDIEA